VRGSDIVITATDSPTPVFDGSALEAGTHVTAMGQYLPETRELDSTTVGRAVYVPDLSERARENAGAFLQARDAGVVTEEHIHGELGDVLVDSVPGRVSEDEITVFDSGGTAIETVAAANLVYERAVEEDLGEVVSFASLE
jgi:alanine dehydrogenase